VDAVKGNANSRGEDADLSHLPTQGDSDLDPVALAEGLARDLSTVALIKEITAEVGQLAQQEVGLAKAELKANLKAEAKAAGGLGLAVLAALTTVDMLLVTVILALARTMPGWAAGLVVSGFTLAATGILGLLGWNMRARSVLARTRGILREEIGWAKQRLGGRASGSSSSGPGTAAAG